MPAARCHRRPCSSSPGAGGFPRPSLCLIAGTGPTSPTQFPKCPRVRLAATVRASEGHPVKERMSPHRVRVTHPGGKSVGRHVPDHGNYRILLPAARQHDRGYQERVVEINLKAPPVSALSARAQRIGDARRLIPLGRCRLRRSTPGCLQRHSWTCARPLRRLSLNRGASVATSGRRGRPGQRRASGAIPAQA